jgi:hypothetical protein
MSKCEVPYYEGGFLPPANTVVIVRDDIRGTPLKKGQSVLYLGEITNMKGHVIVCTQEDGRIYWGYHPENFRVARDDEV